MLRLKEVTKMIRRTSVKMVHARSNSLVTVATSTVSGRSVNMVPSVQMVSRSFHPTVRALSSIVTENLESLGDSITTAVLLKWMKEPGDSVKEDDVIGVVETDKVTMDIRAKKTGVFVGGLVEAGAEISVGSPLYKMDTSVSALPPVSAETVVAKSAPAAPAGATPTVSVPVPIMGESITQGVLAKWMVSTGTAVKADEVVASIETDKVTVEVRSPSAGVIVETFAGEGDEVNVGNPLFTIRALAPGEVPAAAAPKPAAAAAPKAASAPAAAPAAAKTPAPAAPAKVTTMPTGPAPVVATGDRSETRVKMTRMRLRISQRLKEAQNTTAMLTTLQEVDMTNLIAMRNRHKEAFEKIHGVKLGFMSAFVTASTKALVEIPAVNGVIDDTTNEIVYRNYCDVSVAVASPAGLVVPVLRNTEKMNFADVEKTIGMYGAKAKAGSLALEDMTGGTFTISNGGVFGSLFGTPILNLPQSAILGMHATKMRAVVDEKGQVVARPMMYMALTYDHRLVDGREAVTFLKSVQNKIEDPTRLLLDL